MIELVPLRISVSCDESSPFWNCTVELANVEDFVKFKPNDTFTINLLGELYHFYVDNIQLNRNSNYNPSSVITGIGIGADLDFPRKQSITKTWDTDELASNIVNEVLEGRLVSWDLTDWEIPANRLVEENSSRIAVAQRVVQAAGGVLESNPDGTFYVRHLHPISPNDYNLSNFDHEYEEVKNVFEANFSYQNNKYYDWVRIRDIENDEINDTIEFEQDENDSLAGTLKVYPSPYRESIKVVHTGPSDITLVKEGTVLREEEETIEIFEGEGSVRYPIQSIQSFEWNSVNLGGLAFEPYSKTVTSTHPNLRYSMVKIKYTTKSINYRTTSTGNNDVQYLVIDEKYCQGS